MKALVLSALIALGAAPVSAALAAETPPSGGADAIPPGDLSRDPEARGFAEMLFGRCRLSLEDGLADRALAECDRAAATWPADATYIYYTGLILLRMDGDARAEEAATRIARALPPAACRADEWKIRSDLGLARYRAGRAAEAEAELARALALNSSDAPTHFIRGLALLDLDRPDEARKEFETAGGSPDLAGDAHYYKGLALLRTGDEAGAREELRLAAATGGAAGTEPALAGAARDFLDVGAGVMAQETAARPSPFGLRVTAAIEGDSNPSLFNDTLASVFPPLPDGSDGDLRGVLALRADWRPFQDVHGVSGSARFEAYGGWYKDYGDADQVTPGAVLAVAFGGTPIGFLNGPLGYERTPARRSPLAGLVTAGTAYTWVDGESFLRVTTAGAGLQRDWADCTSTELTLSHRWNDWLGVFREQSYTSNTGELSEYVRFGRPDRYLRVGYVYEDRDSDGTPVFDPSTGGFVQDDDAFDSVDKGWIADLSLPLTPRLSFFANVSRRKEDFDTGFPVPSGPPIARRDKQVDYAAAAVFALCPSWYLTGRYGRTKQDSWIKEFGYRRNVWTFAATWHW